MRKDDDDLARGVMEAVQQSGQPAMYSAWRLPAHVLSICNRVNQRVTISMFRFLFSCRYVQNSVLSWRRSPSGQIIGTSNLDRSSYYWDALRSSRILWDSNNSPALLWIVSYSIDPVINPTSNLVHFNQYRGSSVLFPVACSLPPPAQQDTLYWDSPSNSVLLRHCE